MSDRGGLADLLRTWRDHADPTALGLPAGDRRAPGLRREELAALAGLSVDYLVRLEQGRATRPSEQVVQSLARALRLDDEEAAALALAAGLAAPTTTVLRQVAPSVRRLVDRMRDLPVAVYAADWTLLEWNPLWAALLGDPAALRERERNLVRREFVIGDTRTVKSAEETAGFRDALVADLRQAAVEHPDDVPLAALVEDLLATSPAFAERWRTGAVGRHRSSRKRIEHPGLGALEVDCDVLEVPGVAVRIVAYSAEPGSESAERLELLRVVGTEAFHAG